MKREDEMKIAINILFGDKNRTPEQVAAANGFEAGVRWVDRHIDTTVLWRDASEEPEKGELILVEVVNTIPKRNEVRYFVECVEEYVVNLMKTEGFQTRWAYISDLLPKRR